MAERVCRKCKAKYDNGNAARLPFCRACIQILPPAIRSGIVAHAPGSTDRKEAEDAAMLLWGIKEDKRRKSPRYYGE